MKTSTFQGLVLGLVCVSTAGLGGVAVTQHRQIVSLQAIAPSSVVIEQENERWLKVERSQTKQESALATVQRDQQQQAGVLAELQQRVEKTSAELHSLINTPSPEATTVDLVPIVNRLQALEQQAGEHDVRLKQMSSVTRSGVATRTRTTAPSPRPVIKPTPPFTVLSLETRGSEQFLAVLPNGEPALRYVRLIPPGETLGGWRLQVANEQAATFTVEGYPPQTLPISGEH